MLTRDDLSPARHKFMWQAAAAGQAARRYAWDKYGIPFPASVLAAQICHESGWGKHAPANNYLGIKDKRTSALARAALKTWEVVSGKRIVIKARFREYPSMVACAIDQARLICESRYYRKAVAALRRGATWKEYLALMGPVYATDPRYVEKVGDLVIGLVLTGFDMALPPRRK